MQRSRYRGHKIEFLDDIWVYHDTKKPVSESIERDCGICNCSQTDKGHDHCLGTLKHVMNACCGHGETGEAYLQFMNGFVLKGRVSLFFIRILKFIDEFVSYAM